MRKNFAAVALIALVACAFVPASAQSPATGPTFDVVSVKRNATPMGPGFRTDAGTWRPDGGLTMTNIPVGTIIARAYSGNAPADMVGLPAWARSDRYDVSATASLARLTPEDQTSMLRALLADRFKLVAHMEKREQQVYDLVLAHADGRLGRGVTPIDADCGRMIAERTAAAAAASAAGTPAPPPQRPDFTTPPPPCMLRVVGAPLRDRAGGDQQGDLLEGETTMDGLASALRFTLGRPVIDKTALAGSYRMTMNFDGASGRGGPAPAATEPAAPSIFTAVQEQLGLKLVSAKAERDTLIIDRLERPAEN